MNTLTCKNCGRKTPIANGLPLKPRKFRQSRRVDGVGMTNGERADRAQAALNAYIAHTGDAPDECHFSDLLADLQHYANREGIDFAEQLARGTYHFGEENGCL